MNIQQLCASHPAKLISFEFEEIIQKDNAVIVWLSKPQLFTSTVPLISIITEKNKFLKEYSSTTDTLDNAGVDYARAHIYRKLTTSVVTIDDYANNLIISADKQRITGVFSVVFDKFQVILK